MQYDQASPNLLYQEAICITDFVLTCDQDTPLMVSIQNTLQDIIFPAESLSSSESSDDTTILRRNGHRKVILLSCVKELCLFREFQDKNHQN